jgi:hypothetical protein
MPKTLLLLMWFLLGLPQLVPANDRPIISQSPTSTKHDQPEVFAPGVISSGEVYRGSFSADGKSFYFFKRVGEGEDYRIFMSNRSGDSWTTPQRVVLGGEFSDLYPAISRDGHRLIFSSYRPVPGDVSAKPNAHIWLTEWKGNSWSAPVFLKNVNRLGFYHSWVEFGPEGDLYFRQTSPDWKDHRTMIARRLENGFAPPEPFQPVERWRNWRSDFRLAGGSPSPDGNIVFLDVLRFDTNGHNVGSEIWISRRKGQDWTDPAPLGESINAAGSNLFPFFSPDGATLYFVRDFKAFYRVSLNAALATAAQENSH